MAAAANTCEISARELRALNKLAVYAKHLDACAAAKGYGECRCGLSEARNERIEGRFETAGIDPDRIVISDWQR